MNENIKGVIHLKDGTRAFLTTKGWKCPDNPELERKLERIVTGKQKG